MIGDATLAEGEGTPVSAKIVAPKTALLIIDLQNDFLDANGAYARGGDTNPPALLLPGRVAAVARALKAAGGLVVASQFTLWPDAAGAPMVPPHLKALRPYLAKGDFAPGSWGQANVDALAGLVDVAISKVMYSAFFNTQLDWVLRRAGIDTVAVCGIVTNGGVASTVRDAQMRDYRTLVLADGCAAFGAKRHQTALADMRNVAEVTACAPFIDSLA
ncbi:cysteine hydrolase family protein [Verminephrobacter eiseniae]|uniref:cysteine hydrolase family protein n=1 Tax=Verminephrobacter eiseniae TaxID=364317 RepID=UPI00223818B9|nr:isochorismatase family cysteine hydrolase [Verminephrobacter eiseniae]MCW5234702.1 cysteine hydrolase [Verminephrobacter eiseniae]MCW5293723.1 cysteine hydrolase [Verminephrobacter eiseniae]MCW8183514.1 cysteine hydrolase [Verminephrobacter eiseniae]MCW8221848.1 cysteine hydrolase [Verminephrobacter eiseniae]MCW8234427.1 cysteine hydrolase [Verminephrobacter eiseniae]